MAAEERGSAYWAYRACEWGAEPCPADERYTNFEMLLHKVQLLLAAEPWRQTVMRNQVRMAISNNFWPALSRWALMAEPSLAEVIHPRKVEELDDGEVPMDELFIRMTGRLPEVFDWRRAAERCAF